MHSTVPEMIAAVAAQKPDAVAVQAGEATLTYRTLCRQAAGLATHLRGLGVGPGDRVAVALPRGADLVSTLLGVQLAGAAYVPLDPEHPAERLGGVLADADTAVLVAQDAAGVPAVRTVPRVHLGDVALAAQPPIVFPDPTSPAYVIYTSGSTGRPKGVQVSHGALANFVCSMRERPGFDADVILPSVTTVSFDIAALELFVPLTCGGRVVVAGEAEVADPHRLAALLERIGARTMQATPVTWRLLLESGWTPPSGFTVLCGGERLPPELAGRLLAGPGADVVVWDLYGPTETTVWSAVTCLHPTGPARQHPVAGTALHVLDDALAPAEHGELFIGGAGVADGYLARPGLTATRFVADPFGAPGTRLYRTGDLARRHPDGRIAVLGRTDDQLKIRGHRVEPGEIESALLRLPGVAEAAARGVADEFGTTSLVGYVRPVDPHDPPEPRRLQRRLARQLPAHLVPAHIAVLPAFPRTPNGKLDRAALPVPDPSAPVLPVAPTEPPPDADRRAADQQAGDQSLEERVTTLLAEALGVASVGPHDDFFALGGDSLRAVQAILTLSAELGREIPINALFEHRTAYGLALAADGDQVPEAALVALPEGQVPRLSPAQWRLWLNQLRTPRSTADNRPLALRLPRPVDPSAVRAAVADVVARHPVLRSRYRHDASGLPTPVELPVDDLVVTERDGDPATVLADELAQPFDLTTEPPLRVSLVGDVLVVVAHRMAADDRSLELVGAQLRGALRGRAAGPPELRYADYAEWRRELASGPGAERSLAFWRDTLGGLHQADLATDRSRPLVRDERVGAVRFTVPPGRADALADVAAHHDVPPDVALDIALLTGFFGVLGRFSRGDDLTVGTPVALRDTPELAGMVGLVEETAVVRVGVADDPSFADLLGRVGTSAAAARAHAACPFEDVVAAVLDRVATLPEPGRNPLFDAEFAVHPVAAEQPGFALPVPPDLRCDLRCDLTRRPDGGIDGLLRYAVALFDEDTAAAMAAEFEALLGELVTDPTRTLAADRAAA